MAPVVVVLCLGSPYALRASGDDAEFLSLPYLEGFAADPASEHPALDALAYAVERAGWLAVPGGRILLPAGTTVDGVTWLDGVAHVDLIWPAGFDPEPWGPMKVETIYTVLGQVAAEYGPGRGVVIRVRNGPEEDYALLEADRPSGELVVSDDVSGPEVTPADTTASPMSSAGPIAHGGTQPQGALSGVTVFVSAGHGWMYSSNGYWYLERALIYDMVEDYGNLDQLNYFVHYLYNAGATVVPFRPVGYQPVEVVLDNDDPGVTYTGTWYNSSTSAYYYENGVTSSGVPYKWAYASTGETATARYTPNIPVTGFYPVYCWTKDGDDRVRQTYRIKHSGGISEVVVDHRMVGKGWIWLGNYYLTAGTTHYVEITNASPDGGVVIADAIRFGNGMGDVARGSAGVSGYPREEEACRYWAESELGNHAVGFSSSIWDLNGYSDSGDNVGCAARWAREMNRQSVNNDRWRRIYLEFHSNAASGSARGTVCLVTTTGATTYQTQYATILGDTVEDDMVALQSQFEYDWWRRPNPYTSAYGSISTTNNGNEFDATIIEVAFHDNYYDARLLRDPKVRNAVARSCLYGMIDFLSILPGSAIPKVFLPEPPENVQAVHSGDGTVVVSWTAGPSGVPYGDAPAGYKIYRSSDGYGFDNGTDVGNVLSTTLTDVPAAQTVYLRVAAYNAGGESLPSETLAVRRPTSGRSTVLIVNGYDAFSRFENHIQTIPAGPMERPIPRRVNSFDYVVQYAEALTANGLSFDSCSNEAVSAGTVLLAGYDAVVWILGRESSATVTLSADEQTLLSDYLLIGGRLFISGSNLAYDLDGLGNGTFFYEGTLGSNYVADDAGTYTVTGSGGIFSDLGSFDFDPANGAPYDVRLPDRIGAQVGAVPVLGYVGGTGGYAGVQYDAGGYRTVTFGFPFETITSASVRIDIMGRVMGFLLTDLPVRADFDMDGDVDLDDFARLQSCFAGPTAPTPSGCQGQDLNLDGHVDQNDRTEFEQCLNGPNVPPGC